MSTLYDIFYACFRTSSPNIPTQVFGLESGVVDVALGHDHSCAVLDSGAVMCWGANGSGQLGDTTTIRRLQPTQVFSLSSGVINVAAGKSHSCALLGNGSVKCWGSNYFGQLGDTTFYFATEPKQVVSLPSGVSAIAAGAYHNCALINGAMRCWGNNSYGQLGRGTTSDRGSVAVVSNLNSGVTAISAGWLHTCAIKNTGSAMCWGDNSNGGLGDGTKIQRNIPTQVTGLTSGVIAISAGSSHTCSVLESGAVKCWGNNTNGQLGTGTLGYFRIPTSVILNN